MPAVSIVIADFIRSEINQPLAVYSALAIPPVYHYLFFKDPLMPPYSAYEVIIFSLMYIIPFLLVILFLKIVKKNNIVIIAAILTFFSTAIYLDAVHLTADYSTMYNYGEMGFIQAGEYIKSNSSPADAIVSSLGDMPYYTKRKSYHPAEMNSQECYRFFYSDVKYVVLRGDWDQRYSPVLFKCLKEKYTEIKFGNFYIYKVRE